MILITLANFLCFEESFNSKIAHQTAPIMKMIVTNWSIKGTEDVVDIVSELKVKRITDY